MFPFYYSVINKRGGFFQVHPKEAAGFNFVESSIRLSYAYIRWPNLSKAKKMYTTPTNGHKIAKFRVYIRQLMRTLDLVSQSIYQNNYTFSAWQLVFITGKGFLKIWWGLIYWSTDCSAVKPKSRKHEGKSILHRNWNCIFHDSYPSHVAF